MEGNDHIRLERNIVKAGGENDAGQNGVIIWERSSAER